MTEEEKEESVEKYLKENAKIAWDFIFERAEDKFRKEYKFEDFRDWFCGAFGQGNLSTERFRYYYYRACWEYEKD